MVDVHETNQTAYSKATSSPIVYSIFKTFGNVKEIGVVELTGPGLVEATFLIIGAKEAANTMSLFLSKPVM